MVIWITGLAGSGKTTLSQALKDVSQINNLVLLDGDTLREIFMGDLGYSEDDRKKQIGRMQRLAKCLSSQGLHVIVAALYCHPDLLEWNRTHLSDYLEIYLNTSQEVLESRDQKGLYSGAQQGKIKNVVGYDIPWHTPQTPDFILSASQTPQKSAELILERFPAVARALLETQNSFEKNL